MAVTKETVVDADDKETTHFPEITMRADPTDYEPRIVRGAGGHANE